MSCYVDEMCSVSYTRVFYYHVASWFVVLHCCLDLVNMFFVHIPRRYIYNVKRNYRLKTLYVHTQFLVGGLWMNYFNLH